MDPKKTILNAKPSYEIDNFILEADNYFSNDFCDRVIKYFDNMANAGFGFDRSHENRPGLHVQNFGIGLATENVLNLDISQEMNSIFIQTFWNDIYPIYNNKYNILATAEPHKIYLTKLQKTNVQEGYHVWHFEQKKSNERLLAFILYLNDVEEGGETEFLYYSKRISPVKNKIIVFPASFSHAHRGNPPLKGSKYVLTGWVEY
jgi:hypothetical protein